jgi:hypothetical protein
MWPAVKYKLTEATTLFNMYRHVPVAIITSAVFMATTPIASRGADEAQSSAADDANKSNNPLNPAPGLNVQDQYNPKLFNTDSYTNDLLLRGTLPLPPIGFVPVPEILRLTVPVSTRPDPGGGYSTGLGDLNIFDIFLLKQEGTMIGVGPLLTIPTASHDVLGTGKWQAGLAAVVIDPSPQRLFGGLLQWQTSFAGDDDRASVNTLTFQPFFIYNLPQGWYLRSTAIWNFDLRNDKFYIPIGLGAGKTWRMGNDIFNAFIEPQFTVAHHGADLPQFGIFAGLNITLGR